MPDAFSYDVVAYPSFANPLMHPERLWVQGKLFGLDPTPPGRCRLLEVGAGSGTNVIAAAARHPDSQYVGIDLAESAVREGNDLITALGLTNVRLECADLTRWEPDGPFDYVGAHGVYSWVPAPVRDGLMTLVQKALAPNGVAYLSYNTLPGGHLRRAMWDMLKFHTSDLDSPADKLNQVDQFLNFLCEGQEGQNDYPNRWVFAEAKAILDRGPEGGYFTFHDDLSEVNDPVYFLDFVGHAAGHGLKFLAEAALPTMTDDAFPAGVRAVLDKLGQRNPLLREQYRDFLRVRRFRSTLLCHAHQPTRPQPAFPAGLLVGTLLRPAGEPVESPPAEYVTEFEKTVTIQNPIDHRLLRTVCELAPQRVPVAELITCDDPATVESRVLALARHGLLTLYALPFPGVRTAGVRPTVSPLARTQAARSTRVSSQLHTSYELTDEAARLLLPLLDGTRDRATLVEVLRSAMPTLGTAEEVADRLEISLANLARGGLLVA